MSDETVVHDAAKQPGVDPAASAEWEQLNQLLSSFPKVSNYSTALTVIRNLVGPHARIWRRKNEIQMGAEVKGTRYILGAGTTYEAALKLSALTIARSMAAERQKAKLATEVALGGETQKAVGQETS